MRFFRITSLQWGIAGFCLILGALMLVAPAQFDHLALESIHSHLDLWGLLFFSIGAILFAVSVFPVPWKALIATHLVGAAMLLTLSIGYGETGYLLGSANHAILALSLLIIALLGPQIQRERRPPAGRLFDLLALVIALECLVTAVLFLVFPSHLSSARYDPIRLHFRWFGLLFLAAGLLLAASQFLPRRNRLLSRLSYNLAAAAFLIYAAFVPVPEYIWTGVLFYGGFGTCLVLLPWLEPFLYRFNPKFLRTRLGLLLAITIVIPLIVTVTVVSKQEETSVTNEVLDGQREEAAILAEGVSHYISLNQSALLALASQQGLLDQPRPLLHQTLANYGSAYPGVTAFAAFAADGTALARSDFAVTPPITGYPIYEQARATGKPGRDILISPVYKRPIFAFSAPILDNQKQFAGLVTMAIDSSTVAAFLINQNRDPNTVVYLVDERGRVIAHPNQQLVANLSDLSALSPVHELLTSEQETGAFSNGEFDNRRLVGFARVPDLGWNVVVERQADQALASVYTGRELAFGILLIFLLLSAFSGSLLAGWLVTPLTALQRAASQLAAGNNRAPLPNSQITEIQTLTTVFEEMRGRLEMRTQEREQAEEALRQANEALEAKVIARTADLERVNAALESYAEQLMRSNKELQDFASIASHDLQEPLRKIQAFGERLKVNPGEPLDEEKLDYIERMQKSAQRMQTMINDLLAYSRITTKAQPLVPVDLNKIAEEVITDLEIRIEQTQGQVQLEPLPTIIADPLQMRQLLLNLIGNGLKFHRPDLPPLVRVSCSISADQNLNLVVADNGIGFDEQYLERILQPFQRLHGRSEYEGSGIGLAICRKIVERHHGQITAHSQPGQGTNFIVTLPLRQHQEQGEMDDRTTW